MSADAKTLSDCFVTRSPTIADAIRRKTNDASAKEIHHRLGLLTKANVAKFVITEGNIRRSRSSGAIAINLSEPCALYAEELPS
jgi:hypothetical protein